MSISDASGKAGVSTTRPPAPQPHPNAVYFMEQEEGNEVQQVIINTVRALWRSVYELTRLRPAKQEVYWVTIFGSARIKPGTAQYEKVTKLAEMLTLMGEGQIGIITGGGPGLMQAANEGYARASGPNSRHSVGLKIDLEFEKEANPFVTQVYEHKDFFSRLHQFVFMSNAYVGVEGGLGSTLENALVWQLLQVRKLYGTPFILVHPMWKAFVEWARYWMIEKAEVPLADEVDMKIPSTPDTVEEAVDEIRQHFLLWLAHQQELEAKRCQIPNNDPTPTSVSAPPADSATKP